MSFCKKHPSDPAVGVCASCLRDRLLSLQSCVTPRPCPLSSVNNQQQQDHGTRPSFFGAGPLPPPGKKRGFSVLSTLFGTPGGGPSPSGERCAAGRGPDDHPSLARQRLPQAAVPPSFSSWLVALFAVRCRRKKQHGGMAAGCDGSLPASCLGSSGPCGVENNVQPAPRQHLRPTCRFQRYRGMSPGSEPEDEEQPQPQPQPQQEDGDREEDRAAASSPSGRSSSGSSDGHGPALPDPTPGRSCWRRDGAAVRTGFAVCFSPLVRARPHHQRRSRVVAGDSGGGNYGDLQKPEGFRLPSRRYGQQQYHCRRRYGGGGGGVKLCPNRSRKLVDMGRFR